MPTFFAFQQGNESRHPPPDSRYGPGRFRLLPDSVINFPAALTNSLPGSGSAWGGGKGRNGRRKSIFDIFRRRGSDGAGRYERLVGYGAAGRGGAGVGMGAAGNRYSYGAIDGAGAGARRSAGLGLLSGGDVENEDDGEGMEEDERWWWERYIWAPRKRMAARIVGDFWGRFGVLVLLPAGMVILWTAIPFPTYPLDEKAPEGNSTALYNHHNSDYTDLTPLSVNQLSFSVLWQIFTRPLTRAIPNFTNNDLRYFATSDNVNNNNEGNNIPRIGGPGHGEALVRLNFWFFLFVYYGFYNFIGLLWITKLFNLYSLNWWPPRLGFPLTYTIFWSLSLLAAIPLYLHPSLYPLTSLNLTWILLTFITMLCPLLIAFLVLISSHRHISLPQRHILSEVQLLFSPSPINPALITTPAHPRSSLSPLRRNTASPPPNSAITLNPTRSLRGRSQPHHHPTYRPHGLPSSYIRFLWFTLTLLLTLLAYLLGEAYAELYLRTLPHSSTSTILYVWSWILTITTLDALTSTLLGTTSTTPTTTTTSNSKSKVESYPLAFIFKFYFQLTYHIYVRALYARLRSPSQFIALQLLSSSIVVIYQPLSMARWYHDVLVYLGMSKLSYEEYKKYIGRGFYLRGLAENVSMVCWVGWVVVLHYGSNKLVYPYFAFESGTGGWWPGDGTRTETYTFELTFVFSLITWAAEVVSGWVVRRMMGWGFGFDVVGEAARDFAMFPELVGGVVVGGGHVLMNMGVSIVRVRF